MRLLDKDYRGAALRWRNGSGAGQRRDMISKTGVICGKIGATKIYVFTPSARSFFIAAILAITELARGSSVRRKLSSITLKLTHVYVYVII